MYYFYTYGYSYPFTSNDFYNGILCTFSAVQNEMSEKLTVNKHLKFTKHHPLHKYGEFTKNAFTKMSSTLYVEILDKFFFQVMLYQLKLINER